MLAEQDEEVRKDTTGDTSAENETEDDDGVEDLEGQDASDEEDQSSEEDDDKPLTRKDLKEFQTSILNNRNASRRVVSKKEGENINKGPKPSDRLDRVEKELQSFGVLERKRTYGYQNNLSPQEVDLIFKFDKNPSKKTLDDPFVKGGLESIRSQARLKANLPGSAGRAASQYNGKDWKDLKPEERQANFAERRRAILEAKRDR